MPPRAPTRRDLAALGLTIGLFGAAFGTSAVGAGLDPVLVVGMSALVMGGAAQFACLGVLAAGGPVATGVATGLLVNARYVALGLAAASASILPARGRALVFRLHVLGDHAVAFALSAGGGTAARRAFDAAGATVAAAWIVGTAAGAVAGAAVPDPADLGLDAALPAGLAALLGGALRAGRSRRAVAAGAAVALLLVPVAPAGVPALGAAAAGALLGLRREDHG